MATDARSTRIREGSALNPKCRRHHRTRQAPGWKVTQPTPDTVTWTTPSGRTHSTTVTVYET